MAVRVVAVDSPAEPDDVADSEVVGEDPLEPARSSPGLRAWISPSRHSSVVSSVPRPLTSIAPPSITTGAATGRLPRSRRTSRQIQPSRHLAGKPVVAAVVVVLGPAVEFPVDQADVGSRAASRIVLDDERRAGVAEPAPIGRRLEESDRVEVDAHGVELVGDPVLHRAVADDDVDALDAAQVADDLGVDPRDRRELAGPVVAIDAARRSRSPRAAPIRRACGNRGRQEFDP